MTLKNKSVLLFYIILLSVPLNLGVHFVLKKSYITGLLVDYLIPTIYVQDILAFVLSVVFLILLFKSRDCLHLLYKRDIQIGILFIFSTFLSVFSSELLLISFTSWLRLVLYFLVFVFCRYLLLKNYVYYDFLYRNIYFIFLVAVLFLSILGVFQFILKGSFFDNYLFFGEQPYSISTHGISREFIFGKTFIPPYSLFRHPNIFGGFLSIALLWLFDVIKRSLFPRRFVVPPFALGLLSLFLTFSLSSWIVLLMGILIYLVLTDRTKLLKRRYFNYRYLLIVIFSAGFLLSVFFPYVKTFDFMENEPSFFRRKFLFQSVFEEYTLSDLFGTGYGTSVLLLKDHYFSADPQIRFLQPVHNIFVLLLAESGIFSLILFFYLIYSNLIYKNSIFSITLLQLLMLGLFDHYIFTMHQMHLLLWITLALTKLKTT